MDIVENLRGLSRGDNSDFSLGDEAAEEISRLRERVAELEAKLKEATEWRPIESAPKNGEWLLIYDPRYRDEMPVTFGSYMQIEDRDTLGRFKKGEWFGFEWDGMPSAYEPTHYLPLPAPPCQAPESETPVTDEMK